MDEWPQLRAILGAAAASASMWLVGWPAGQGLLGVRGVAGRAVPQSWPACMSASCWSTQAVCSAAPSDAKISRASQQRDRVLPLAVAGDDLRQRRQRHGHSGDEPGLLAQPQRLLQASAGAGPVARVQPAKGDMANRIRHQHRVHSLAGARRPPRTTAVPRRCRRGSPGGPGRPGTATRPHHARRLPAGAAPGHAGSTQAPRAPRRPPNGRAGAHRRRPLPPHPPGAVWPSRSLAAIHHALPLATLPATVARLAGRHSPPGGPLATWPPH